MIHFQQVSIDRGGKTILKNVSFSVERGQKIVLTGPSGSGKSLLLMALMGVFPVSSGKIVFEGGSVTPKTIAQVRRSIAFIGQEPVLGAETIHEALMLPFQFRANRDEKPSDSEIRNVLDRLKLSPDILEKRCSVVSGGEKQRIAIARALLMKKKVFLADEITSALDAESRKAVFDVFSSPSCTALLVSHDPEWIKCFDRVLEVRDGTVRVTGFRGEG